jgi:hypothetical protein
LPDPLLDVRHVIADARIDVAEDLLPLHDATSFRRVQARPRDAGARRIMASEMSQSPIGRRPL